MGRNSAVDQSRRSRARRSCAPLHALIGQLLFWLLGAAVLLILFFWERQTLGSLWLQPFRSQSIAWGLALVVAHYTVLFPAGEARDSS